MSGGAVGRRVEVGLNAVIVAVTEEEPRLLTVHRAGDEVGLPYGPLDPDAHRTLERGLLKWVREQTGLGLGYVEQLYTFGDRDRDPGHPREGRRVLSIGYLALVREGRAIPGGASWRDVYEFFPWEDWRGGRPAVLEEVILPGLRQWAESAEEVGVVRGRSDRIDITFGRGGATWDGERVLDRYELLYEAGLVAEAVRDRGGGNALRLGRPMSQDHRRILATALGRLRGKLRYRPVVFELLPPTFTFLQLQQVVEALSGVRLHKQNFRRLVERGGLVEGTGQLDPHTGGRPAELFRFRREVLRERPTPGVGLPRGATRPSAEG